MNPHDKEFALMTAALWKKDLDNYAYCCFPVSFAKHRSYHRQERILDGQTWTKHNLQQVNHAK